MKKLLYIVIGFFGFLLLAGIFFGEDTKETESDTIPKNNHQINENVNEREVNDDNQSDIDKTIQQEDQNKFDIEISLKEMSEIYYNNELNGNKQFFGKKVKTKAKFNETSSGTFSGLIAYFDGIDSIYKIHCTSFDKSTEKNLSTFNRNEIVNIIGTVDELVSSSIKFKNCKIYKD